MGELFASKMLNASRLNPKIVADAPFQRLVQTLCLNRFQFLEGLPRKDSKRSIASSFIPQVIRQFSDLGAQTMHPLRRNIRILGDTCVFPKMGWQLVNHLIGESLTAP